MRLYRYLKQIFDYLGAIALTILLSPLLLLILLIIKFDSNGPVLFKQKRVGKGKVEFEIYKFRTMAFDAPSDLPTHLLQEPEKYITRAGKFLRKSSLDELPQLFNILLGQMSFIGPRPALWNQFDLIEARDAQFHKFGISANSIKPGITGWAQVNGRDDLPISAKADFDGFYAKNASYLLDSKIILMTISNIITSKGISEGGQKKG
jgi:O-antigen biosynthesis protein WbqP